MSNNQRRRTLDATSAKSASQTAKRRQLVAEVTKPKEPSGDSVLVTVPKDFHLVLDHHHDVKYRAGTYEMPLEHAEHWWSKANGVALAN